MKRIIMHWTGSTHKANAIDRRHYHLLIEGDGTVVPGDLAPEANESTADGQYAAHTRSLNTGSIGVALCAMHGAKERPFHAGNYPITEAQLGALADVCADLCATYRIPVDRRTVLTHAEVQPTLGVAQRGKWDVTWVPGMDAPGDPVAVGDVLRASISAAMAPLAGAERPRAPVRDVATSAEGGGALTGIAALVGAVLTGIAGLDSEVQLAGIGAAIVVLGVVFWKRIKAGLS